MSASRCPSVDSDTRIGTPTAPPTTDGDGDPKTGDRDPVGIPIVPTWRSRAPARFIQSGTEGTILIQNPMNFARADALWEFFLLGRTYSLARILRVRFTLIAIFGDE